jgi:hypothetical protein
MTSDAESNRQNTIFVDLDYNRRVNIGCVVVILFALLTGTTLIVFGSVMLDVGINEKRYSYVNSGITLIMTGGLFDCVSPMWVWVVSACMYR